jgi:hypothetical protein
MTTVADILRDDLARIGARAADHVGGTRGVVALPPLTRETVLSQVRTGLAPLSEITVGDVVKVAWGACRTLHQAGRESLAKNAAQPVHLDGYSVPIDYEPRLDITVEDIQVATVHFRLRVTVEMFRLDGSLERGRLVNLACEALQVTATVDVEGHQVAERKVPLDLRIELPLPAAGLPVVRAALSLESDHDDSPEGDRLG